MNENSTSILVKNVTVSYRNGHKALWNASFEIPYGTITALVGINGFMFPPLLLYGYLHG